MRYTATPESKELTLDSRATQSERIAFADALRLAAAWIETHQLRTTERMSFSHIEFVVEDDE